MSSSGEKRKRDDEEAGEAAAGDDMPAPVMDALMLGLANAGRVSDMRRLRGTSRMGERSYHRYENLGHDNAELQVPMNSWTLTTTLKDGSKWTHRAVPSRVFEDAFGVRSSTFNFLRGRLNAEVTSSGRGRVSRTDNGRFVRYDEDNNGSRITSSKPWSGRIVTKWSPGVREQRDDVQYPERLAQRADVQIKKHLSEVYDE